MEPIITNFFMGAVISLPMLLPAFEDFSRKAELDVPLPISATNISKLFIHTHSPSGAITITNRHYFNWSGRTSYVGRIVYYDRMFMSSSVQEKPDRMRELASLQSKYSTNEIAAIATRIVEKTVGPPEKLGIHISRLVPFAWVPEENAKPLYLPIYQIVWDFKKAPTRQKKALEMEISGLTGKLTRFSPFFLNNYTDLRQYSFSIRSNTPPPQVVAPAR